MAIKVIPFEGWHFDWLDVQPEQKAEVAAMTDVHRRVLERERSWTATTDDRIVACGGVVPLPGRCRALLWVAIGALQRSEFLAFHSAVKRCIDEFPYHRIEMEVANGFEAGHRWAKALGFHEEPMGGSYTLYVRIR